MGGGTKFSGDSPKGPPRDILAELAAVGAPGFRDAAAFCGQAHIVEFQAVGDSSVRIGLHVRLDAGTPPLLVSAHEVIGPITSQNAAALSGCLAMNFSLAGVVDTFDPETRVGVASLVGAVLRAA
jgi:hypothetical protein